MRHAKRAAASTALGSRRLRKSRKAQMVTSFTVDYWRDGRWYVGQLREMPMVASQGRTLTDLKYMLQDAYRLLLDCALEGAQMRCHAKPRLIEISSSAKTR